MIILLLVLAILATSVCIYVGVTSDDDLYIFATIGIFLAVILMIPSYFCLDDIISLKYVDEKIVMYTEENTNIENQMDTLINQYMDYESSTLEEFKSQSSVTLVAMYPELKSDTLVQSQLETYVTNNNKIKELKEKKINVGVSRWWLYFGK